MKNGKYMEEGGEFWYFNDVLHREDGPASVERKRTINPRLVSVR